MPSEMITHTIAFAPSKGPSLLHQFFWEKFPYMAKQLKEKEIRVHISPGKTVAQWHRVVGKPKLFIDAQLAHLLNHQEKFDFSVQLKAGKDGGELVLQIPAREAEEVLNAHNIFFHYFLPFTRISTKKFEADFSEMKVNHVQLHAEKSVMKKLTPYIHAPTGRQEK